MITHTVISLGLSAFLEGILEYIAGWVVRSVSKKVSCQCSFVLVRPAQANEYTSALLTLKNNGGLVVPSASVLRIVRQCEIVLRSCVNIKKVVPGQWKGILVSKMLAEMPSDIFPELNEHSIETLNCIDTHRYILTKLICRQFLMLRCHHTINVTNLKLTGDKIRQHMNKTVLFQHQ